MGNYFIYPAPKSSYESSQEDPTLINVPNKIGDSSMNPFFCYEKRRIPSKIPCRYIPCQTHISPYLIVFFHGNSEDIGNNLSLVLLSFSRRFGMNVICPEYPTYGTYKKKDPTLTMEEAILQDARVVIEYCHKVLRYEYKNIILIGRSLGSSVATKMACQFHIRGLVLISPFTSIRKAAEKIAGNILAKAIPNIFRSIEYIEHVKAPVLFIHGRQDTLIPYQMAIELYDKTRKPKFLKINDRMTHNQFKIESDVFTPIQAFMVDQLDLGSYLLPSTEDEGEEDEMTITEGDDDLAGV